MRNNLPCSIENKRPNPLHNNTAENSRLSLIGLCFITSTCAHGLRDERITLLCLLESSDLLEQWSSQGDYHGRLFMTYSIKIYNTNK